MPLLAFYDADVVFSRTLRDWLFLLRAETGGELFTLASSTDVLFEAGARLRDHYPAKPASLVEALRQKFFDFTDEIVEEFPGGPVDGMEDPGDWHVHHAASACQASILLTQNIKDFHADSTCYEAWTCDEFFVQVNSDVPQTVADVAWTQARYWAKQPGGRPLEEALAEAGCPQFAACVKGHLQTRARLP